MFIGTIFVNNGEQSVQLPNEARFPDGIKQVNVRVVGSERTLSLSGGTWDSFFLSEERVSDDFMVERSCQTADKM